MTDCVTIYPKEEEGNLQVFEVVSRENVPCKSKKMKALTKIETTKCTFKHYTLSGILNINPHASGENDDEREREKRRARVLEAAKRLRFLKWTGHLTRLHREGIGGLQI